MSNLTRTAANDNPAGNARKVIGTNGQDQVVGRELGNALVGSGLENLSGNRMDDGADSFVTLATLNNVTNASLSDLLVPHGSIP